MEKKNFWNNLPKPFFVMAPMADVTDAAFRSIIAKYGKPDLFYTEFVSCDGLMSAGRETLMEMLKYSEEERPIVAQIFGGKPDNFYECAKFIASLGFDGIDINMGCPDKGVEKQCAGAYLMKDHNLAIKIIREVKRGCDRLPVSIKIRTGYNDDNLDEFLPKLLKEDLLAIAIHARTRKEMSKVPARWEDIRRAVKIRNELKSKTLIIGNGDVVNIEDAELKAKESGADGVMIGRAIFGNPWLFRNPTYIPSVKEKLAVMLEHTNLFEEIFGNKKNFAIMKKHFGAYAIGFDGAKELRMKLMTTNSAKEVEEIVSNFNVK